MKRQGAKQEALEVVAVIVTAPVTGFLLICDAAAAIVVAILAAIFG